MRSNQEPQADPDTGYSSARELRLLAGGIARLFIALLILECGIRFERGELFGSRNLVEERIDRFRTAYPGVHDPELGWVPRPNSSVRSALFGTSLNIDALGMRRGISGHDDGETKSILAIGDSYTFGDEVSDGQTWPAILERLLGKKVHNGGVFAYGLDQIFLRARREMKILKPDYLVISFLPQAIQRSEYKTEGNLERPYFTINDNGLQLQNVPVPELPAEKLDFLREIGGYSYLFDAIMTKIRARYWLQGDIPRMMVGNDSMSVCCELVQKLAALSTENQTRILIVLQMDPWLRFYETAEPVLVCAEEAGIAILDLYPELKRIQAERPEEFRLLFNEHGSHMTPHGNSFVANRIRGKLLDL